MNIDNLSEWIDQTYAEIKATTTADLTESVQLSSSVQAPSITTNGIDEGPATLGYGTLGLGSALVLAYLYKKQMNAKSANDINGDDEDFQRFDD